MSNDLKALPNPFYHNYVFTDRDVERAKLRWWEYPFIYLLPTYVQATGDFAFHFKLFQGKIYITKIEPMGRPDD